MFKRRHFPVVLILVTVRWSCKVGGCAGIARPTSRSVGPGGSGLQKPAGNSAGLLTGLGNAIDHL
jgi:hypothetical protein